jgi:hypothetical protein
MAKKIQLQIPKPCHENWNEMTPYDQGRFCNSCQKNVVDFTGMSDSQLVAFFKKPTTGSVCGRFMNDQLEREILIPRKRLPWMKYFFQISIPIFLANMKSQSQDKLISKGDTVLTTCTKPSDTKIVLGQSVIPQKVKNISGRVVDEIGEGLPYATVMIKGTRNGVACDNKGNFKIGVTSVNRNVILVVSCIGFNSFEKTVDITKTDKEEIVLSASAALSGEIVVTACSFSRMGKFTAGYVVSRSKDSSGIIKRDSVYKSIKNLFIKDPVRIYPNPAKAGSAIKIETARNESGDCQIELFNLQGQLMNSATLNNDEKSTVMIYKLPNTIAGSYFLKITNRKSGKQQTEKIIVQ